MMLLLEQKPMKAKHLCLMLSSAILSGCGSPSQGPSLKETMGWMQQTLALHNGQRLDSDRLSSEVKLVNKLIDHDCKLEYMVTDFETVEYDLKDIDPSSFKQEPIGKAFWVTFKTRNFNHSVRYIHPTEPNDNYDSESGGFALDSNDVATSFQKALHHAVELCGGKPSTF
jgi:hypothetical protein